MLGLTRYILPLIGGASNTPYAQPASDTPYLDGARAQGGIAGFMHPYIGAVSGDPARWANSLIPVDVALGRGDFYDIASLYSDEAASMEMYHRLLNAGFRLPATGGTDNFPDVWRDPPPGTDRTYAKVDGRLTLQSWMAAVKAGRTFATTGPLLFLDVDGIEPGGEVRVRSNRHQLRATVRVYSLAPLSSVEILVNGRAEVGNVARDTDVRQVLPRPPVGLREFWTNVSLPEGGWIAARARGSASPYIGDSNAFAHTSPVYVTRDGAPPFVSKADAQFLADVTAAIAARVARGPWRSNADRDAMLAEIEQARQVYLKRAGS
jgi:hypothetical protein